MLMTYCDGMLNKKKTGSFRMFTQYFGNYLFEAKILTREQFKEALQQIANKRAKLGVLAIEANYMTPTQVESTHALQLQIDKKFGEIAIEKGYLTSEQLETLLSRQSSPFSVFSQVMIDQGYLTYTQLSENLVGYRNKCGMSEENFTRFKSGDIVPLIEKIVLNKVGNKQREVVVMSYIEVFMKNVMRFINENITIDEIETVSSIQSEWIASQKMTGTQNIITSYGGSEEAMIYFSTGFSKKIFTKLDAMSRDILGEFLNCSNGIFIANIAAHGLNLDLEPQYVTSDTNIAQSQDMLRISFSIENYPYQLVLAF
jgi:CheY-specific phosphatase CheX